MSSSVAGLCVLAVATATAPAISTRAAEDRGSAACPAAVASGAVRASSLGTTDKRVVREVNGFSRAELSRVVADPRGWVDRCGAVFYVESVRDNPRDAHPQERGFSGESHSAVQGEDEVAVQPTTEPTDVLDLSSLPGSARTLYLDFSGDTTTGTAWNKSYGVTTIASPAYSINAPADAVFDAQERAAIHLAWRSVAEDFAPFDVNVTTREPSAGAITRTSLADQTYGARVVVTGSNQLATACSCGGLAYLDVFDDVGNEEHQPSWVFTSGTGTNGYDVAQSVSHEAGHNFGLHHDGTGSSSYYTGAKGWAPVMGASYGRRLSQWSNGRYPDASNGEDDVLIIARSAPVVTDDHGGNALTATALPADTTTAGLIGTRSDTDAFSFVASGYTSLAVGGGPGVSDLDVALTVVDVAGDVVASVDPTSDIAQDASLDAMWTAVLPSASAAYTAFISGTGHGDPAVAGRYDDYGSLGSYHVTLRTAGSAPDPTPTPTPTPTPPSDTASHPAALPPSFLAGRQLPRALLGTRYRASVRFTGPVVSVRVRRLPPGLTVRRGPERLVLRGHPQRRGRFDIRVTLRGPEMSVRRTFRLAVR